MSTKTTKKGAKAKKSEEEVIKPEERKSTRSKAAKPVEKLDDKMEEEIKKLDTKKMVPKTKAVPKKKAAAKMEIEATDAKEITKVAIEEEIKVEVKPAQPTKAKAAKATIKLSDVIKTTATLGPEKILDRAFFKQNIIPLSQALVGKILVRHTPEGIVKARIVEAEAYCGLVDKACHAYGGKKTDRTKWMYPVGGHVYIYSIYGNNYCLNVTSGEEGDPSAVLIRAVEPVENLELIKKWRNLPKLSGSGKELCNGPGKVGKALNLDKNLNGLDLTLGKDLYIIDNTDPFEMEISTRINIDYAEEDKDKPWRYFIKKNVFVSVK
jgi:DNA-3-methyladenine glycosylase